METECCVCADQGVTEDDDDDSTTGGSFYWRGSGQCNTYKSAYEAEPSAGYFTPGCAYVDSEYIRNHSGKSYAECGIAPWNMTLQDFQINPSQQGNRFTSRMWFTVCFVIIPAAIFHVGVGGFLTLFTAGYLLSDEGDEGFNSGLRHFTPFAALWTITKFFDDDDHAHYDEQAGMFGLFVLTPIAIISGSWYYAIGNQNSLSDSASRAGFWMLPISLLLILHTAARYWVARGGTWEQFKMQLHYGTVRPILLDQKSSPPDQCIVHLICLRTQAAQLPANQRCGAVARAHCSYPASTCGSSQSSLPSRTPYQAS